jgi:D-alanyl-D-alanine dipeptidase
LKSKKGAIPFSITLVVFMVFVLIYAFGHLSSKYNQFDKKIGERQYGLIKTYQEAEKALLYIDESAKQSLPQAIYNLAQNGGIEEIEFTDNEQPESYKCGKFNGAYVWFKITKDRQDYIDRSCFDESSAALNLENSFNEILNSFFRNYPGSILEKNYNYEVNKNIEIIGKAKDPLEFDILKFELDGTEEEIIETTPNPEGLRDFTGTKYCPKGRKCKLKEGAYQLFVEAYNLADQRGKQLEFISGYRTLEQQWALWNGSTSERYAQRFPNENERRKWVCDPRGGGIGCPHLTGNAVDVTFKGKRASEMSRQEKYELHNIMADAGWVRYGDENDLTKGEPWHFECCGTSRFNRAEQASRETGRRVTAIV